METGIGIWIFSKAFPKRSDMEKKHMVSEWLLFTLIMVGGYSFPTFFGKLSEKKKYLLVILGAYSAILLIYLVYKMRKKQLGSREVDFVISILFVAMVIWISCQYWDVYQSYTAALVGNLLPAFFLFAFYQCDLVQAYLWEFLYVTNLGLIKMVYITYVGAFKNKHFEEFFLFPRVHSYSEVVYLLVIYSILFLFCKYVPIHQILKRVLDKYKKILFMVTISEWFILLILMNFGKGRINKKNLTVTLISVIGIVILLLVLLVKSFGKTIDTERRLLAVRYQAVECQYSELKEAYEKYRCLVHDEKHMIFFLGECLQNGEIEDAQKFLEDCQYKIIAHSNHSWTGISTLDFMLNMKKEKMDRSKIHFYLDPNIGNIPMGDADFVVMLGNLFDNAIEAAEKCEIGKRKIELLIQTINEMFILKIRNTSISKPNRRYTRFITDKEDKDKHGWGIESVRHIVAKYQGQLTFQYGDEFFEVSIIVNE